MTSYMTGPLVRLRAALPTILDGLLGHTPRRRGLIGASILITAVGLMLALTYRQEIVIQLINIALRDCASATQSAVSAAHHWSLP